jgi:hypothetical protein
MCHSSSTGTVASDSEGRMPGNQAVQDQLELRATQLRDAAERLPEGCERQDLLFRARRMEDASIIIDKLL